MGRLSQEELTKTLRARSGGKPMRFLILPANVKKKPAGASAIGPTSVCVAKQCAGRKEGGPPVR
jgi:hypothetical protein